MSINFEKIIAVEVKDKLDLAFNESTINFVDIGEKSIEVVFDFISMDSNGEFPNDNRHLIAFNNFGRIALSYKMGSWDNENAKILSIEPNTIKQHFNDLNLDSMYGWEFINLGEEEFTKWSDKLSLDLMKREDWKSLNTIDLFGEQIGTPEVTIDIRIWFDEMSIKTVEGKELSLQEFTENAQRGWDQMYKTGISTSNHKTTKLKYEK
ncbi:MAG: hypothetical protein HWE22_18285 [Flavobacteriales bacterium]|nr:hypothetical protein [Flavobacteriales bacterium]